MLYITIITSIFLCIFLLIFLCFVSFYLISGGYQSLLHVKISKQSCKHLYKYLYFYLYPAGMFSVWRMLSFTVQNALPYDIIDLKQVIPVNRNERSSERSTILWKDLTAERKR